MFFCTVLVMTTHLGDPTEVSIQTGKGFGSWLLAFATDAVRAKGGDGMENPPARTCCF